MGIYTADFYCVAAKLVVEVDGDSHLTEEARQYDRIRDQWMAKQGIRILRFTCTEVERDTQRVLKMIDEALVENPSPPDPLSP
jgi:very-short-patch-repair endonuclease